MGHAMDQIKKHPIFLYAQDLADLCNPLEALNITTFNHMRMTHEKSFSVLATNPEWCMHYVKNKYYNTDVVADKRHCHLLNCLMWDNLNVKGTAAQMLADATAFGFNHIFTIVKASADYVDIYNFGTTLHDQSINQVYVNHYDLLETFITYFHETVQHHPHLVEAYNIEILLGGKDTLINNDRQGFGQSSSDIRAKFIAAINKKLGHEKSNDSTHSKPSNIIHFTPRELDCIPLLIQGFTARDIAHYLGISHRTVEDYISLLKQKLNARNKSELISKLLT